MAKLTKVIAGFPNTRRGEFTLLKTDPKRELLAYALDRAVVLRLAQFKEAFSLAHLLLTKAQGAEYGLTNVAQVRTCTP